MPRTKCYCPPQVDATLVAFFVPFFSLTIIFHAILPYTERILFFFKISLNNLFIIVVLLSIIFVPFGLRIYWIINNILVKIDVRYKVSRQ